MGQFFPLKHPIELSQSGLAVSNPVSIGYAINIILPMYG